MPRKKHKRSRLPRVKLAEPAKQTRSKAGVQSSIADMQANVQAALNIGAAGHAVQGAIQAAHGASPATVQQSVAQSQNLQQAATNYGLSTQTPATPALASIATHTFKPHWNQYGLEGKSAISAIADITGVKNPYGERQQQTIAAKEQAAQHGYDHEPAQLQKIVQEVYQLRHPIKGSAVPIPTTNRAKLEQDYEQFKHQMSKIKPVLQPMLVNQFVREHFRTDRKGNILMAPDYGTANALTQVQRFKEHPAKARGTATAEAGVEDASFNPFVGPLGSDVASAIGHFLFDQRFADPSAPLVSSEPPPTPAAKIGGLLSGVVHAEGNSLVNPLRSNITHENTVPLLPQELAGESLGYLAYLDRPGAAARTALAKLLASDINIGGLHIDSPLSAEQEAKIKAAPNPLEAFLHGSHNPDTITGGDIAEAVGLPVQSGLLIDFATDPLMYIGGGLLESAGKSAAVNLAARGARLARVAPNITSSTRYIRLVAAAHDTGDFTKLEDFMSEAEKAAGLGKRLSRGDRKAGAAAVDRAVKARNEQHLESVRSALQGGVKVGDETYYFPGKTATEALADVARSQRYLRGVEPGIRINVGSPFSPNSRRLFSIPVKTPKALRDRAFLPSGTTALSKAKLAHSRAAEQLALAPEFQKIDAERTALEGELKTAKKGHDLTRENQIALELHQLDAREQMLRNQISNAAVNSNRYFETPNEWAKRVSDKRFVHEVTRVSNQIARNINLTAHTALDDIIKSAGIANEPDSIYRVALYNHLARADVGGPALFEKVLGPLTKEEQIAADGIRDLYAELGRHGLQAGTLDKMIADYTPRIYQTTSDWRRGLNRESLIEETPGMGTGATSTPMAQHHRTAPELASVADPTMLAQIIKDLSKNPMTEAEALKHADEFFRLGQTRTTLETLARSVQRGNRHSFDELLPAEQKAVKWAEYMGKNDPSSPSIFKPLDMTEGELVLAKEAERQFPEEAFEGLSERQTHGAKLYSAEQDLARILDARNAVGKGNRLYKEYTQIAKRLRAEVKDLRSRPVAAMKKVQDLNKQISAQASKSKAYAKELEKIEKEGPPKTDRVVAAEAALGKANRDLKQFQDYLEKDSAEHAARPSDKTDEEIWSFINNEDAVHDEALKDKIADDIADALDADTHEQFVSNIADARKELRLARAAQTRALKKTKLPSKRGLANVDRKLAALRRQRDDAQDALEDYAVPPRKISAPKEEPGPAFHDPFDYTGQLNDLRAGKPGGAELGTSPVLDPRNTLFWRSSTEAIHTALNARWRAIDGIVGRSLAEARGKVVYGPDGAIPAHDIKPLTEAPKPKVEGKIKPIGEGGAMKPDTTIEGEAWMFDKPPVTGWVQVSTGRKFKENEIDVPESTLRASPDGEIWTDLKTGEEYRRPALIEENLGRAIEDTIGSDRLWPTRTFHDVQGEMLRQGETAHKQIFDDALSAGFNRAMALFRYGVTTPYPAFHIRNMMTDLLKSLQADAGVMFHPLSALQMARFAARGGKDARVMIPGLGRIRHYEGKWHLPGFEQPLSHAEFAFILDQYGIRSTQHLVEYLWRARTGKALEKNSAAERVLQKLNPGPTGGYGEWAIKMGSRREDYPRFLTFMQRMRRNGGDVADASFYATRHHFDYADLSANQRQVMRNLFLFYTWYRKNIPLQLQELFIRPGFFSGVVNSYESLATGESPINVNWSKIAPWLPDMSGPVPMPGSIPDYMLAQLGSFATDWNGHTVAFGIGAPWVDLNLVQNLIRGSDIRQDDLQQMFSMLTPGIGIPVQLIYGLNTYTGAQYKRSEPIPTPIASLLHAVGIEPGVDENGHPVLPYWASVIIRNIPIFGRGSSYFVPQNTPQASGFLPQNRQGIAGLFGVNTYFSPDNPKDWWESWLKGRYGERSELGQELNLPKDQEKTQLFNFDMATREEAKRKGVPMSWLKGQSIAGKYNYMPNLFGPGSGIVNPPGVSLDSNPLTPGSSASPTSLKSAPLTVSASSSSSSSSSSGSGTTVTPHGNVKKGPLSSPQALRSSIGGILDKAYGLEPKTDAPLFPHEGANQQAYAYFKPYAKDGPYETELTPKQEKAYQTWMKKLPSDIQASAKVAHPDYDYRGYWLSGGRTWKDGFPDKYKTPYDTTFSGESKYALPGAPIRWNSEGNLVNTQTGQFIAPSSEDADKNKPQPKGPKLPQIEGLSSPDQAEFAAYLSKYTGLSPRVVGAWVKAEGGHPGYSTTDNNWLNIGYTDSGPLDLTNDPGWSTPQGAAKLTAQFMAGEKFGASDGIQAILGTVGQSDAAQMRAITSSGWASSGYGGSFPTYNDISVSGTYRPKGVPKGPYRYPVPGATTSDSGLSRTDRGVDFYPTSGNNSVVAIGKAKILQAAPGVDGNFGGGVIYQLLDGPKKGKYVYNYEGLDPTVKEGQVVQAGDQIATMRSGGSIEIGWASDAAGTPLSNARGEIGAGHAPGALPTGEHFSNFIQRLPGGSGEVTNAPSAGSSYGISGTGGGAAVPGSPAAVQQIIQQGQRTLSQLTGGRVRGLGKNALAGGAVSGGTGTPPLVDVMSVPQYNLSSSGVDVSAELEALVRKLRLAA